MKLPNREWRREYQRASLRERPKAMRRVEAQVNAATADELHAKLVAQGVARRAPEDPLELYWVQCAYVAIAAKRRLPGGPDEALAAVTAEVAELTGGLPLPMYR